jgi:hypothetical protein
MHNFVTIHHHIVNKHALVPFFDTYLWTHVTKSWWRLYNLMINDWSHHQFHLHLEVRRYNTHTPSLFQHCSNLQKTTIAANDKHLGLIHVWSGITQTDSTTNITGRYSLAISTFPFTNSYRESPKEFHFQKDWPNQIISYCLVHLVLGEVWGGGHSQNRGLAQGSPLFWECLPPRTLLCIKHSYWTF